MASTISSEVIDITSNPEVKIPGQDSPPSPPLTRSNSVASASDVQNEQIADKKEQVVEEGWDPLQHGTETEDEEFVAARVVQEAGDSVVDINGRVIYPSRSNLHLETDLRTHELQPWDLVDPPPTNGEKQLNSYGTLTSSARSRTLIPKSSYYFGPPPPGSAFGSHPTGQIGLHHPREIIRVERDYTGGELIQFAPIYPLELEGRITPTQFLESMNSINELLISAHSVRRAMIDNLVSVFSLQLSTVLLSSHYEKEMKRLQQLFDELNMEVYNPSGLNLLWPQKVAFLFLEIEYY